jgi:predicted AAA+ superfamily ATPase
MPETKERERRFVLCTILLLILLLGENIEDLLRRAFQSDLFPLQQRTFLNLSQLKTLNIVLIDNKIW